MHHRKIKLNFNALFSTLLSIALFAPLLRAQVPAKPDREAINAQIRALMEKIQNRKRPELLEMKGVGPLREGVTPKLDGQSQTLTQPDTRPQNAPARTLVVTSTADDGPGSLRKAIADAFHRDVITITTTGTISLTSGELLINKSLTIRGPGAANLSVSADGVSRVFHVTPDTSVTISGLTIINGNAPNIPGAFPDNAGGGIYSDHAELTLNNCVVSGNFARFGGGIFSNSKDGGNSSLTVNNTTISQNTASYGGGIFSGGGFFSTGPSGSAALLINNSNINENSADFGGGIFNDGFLGSAMLTIGSSEVNQNSLTHSITFFAVGAGIYNNGDSGFATLEIDDSSVNGNGGNANIPLEGIGIVNDGSDSVTPGDARASLYNSTVSNNLAGGGILNNGRLLTTNSSMNNNTGIGINAEGGSAVLTETAICGNIAGGILNRGPADLTLIRSAVTGNSADDGGGIANFTANLTLIDTTVSGNSAQGAGGGIFNDAGDAAITLRNSTISNNTASFGPGIYSLALGGATLVTVTNSTISGNVSPCPVCLPGGFNGNPGGIFNASSSGNSTLTVNDSTFSDNVGWSILNYNFDPLGSTATVDVANTILAAGPASGSIANVDGTIVSRGYNLSNDAAGGDNLTGPGGLLNGPGDIRNTDPLLGPLQNNGGPSLTHALLLHSPAIDAGDPNFDPKAFEPALRYDQRDLPRFPRVVNGRIDIGAFESKPPGDDVENREP